MANRLIIRANSLGVSSLYVSPAFFFFGFFVFFDVATSSRVGKGFAITVGGRLKFLLFAALVWILGIGDLDGSLTHHLADAACVCEALWRISGDSFVCASSGSSALQFAIFWSWAIGSR